MQTTSNHVSASTDDGILIRSIAPIHPSAQLIGAAGAFQQHAAARQVRGAGEQGAQMYPSRSLAASTAFARPCGRFHPAASRQSRRRSQPRAHQLFAAALGSTAPSRAAGQAFGRVKDGCGFPAAFLSENFLPCTNHDRKKKNYKNKKKKNNNKNSNRFKERKRKGKSLVSIHR